MYLLLISINVGLFPGRMNGMQIYKCKIHCRVSENRPSNLRHSISFPARYSLDWWKRWSGGCRMLLLRLWHVYRSSILMITSLLIFIKEHVYLAKIAVILNSFGKFNFVHCMVQMWKDVHMLSRVTCFNSQSGMSSEMTVVCLTIFQLKSKGTTWGLSKMHLEKIKYSVEEK